MKKNTADFKIITAQLTLMSLMLFFSHCSLHFTLETALDFNAINVSHQRHIQKLQSVDCCAFNAESATITKANSQLDQAHILGSAMQADISLKKTILKDLPVVKPLRRKSISQTIPLYILYQSMKYFIS
ncbi:MAG: hypothetical protein ACTHY4_01805 [Flavobacteriaceae bacterium]